MDVVSLVQSITIPFLFGWIAWIIFTTIRRYKVTKMHAEMQTKLLEKFASNQELMAYVQSDSGKGLLESLSVERTSPYGRIIVALQTGIILTLFGIALLGLHTKVPGEGYVVLGALTLALGIGFALSALASYLLSKSFGLLDKTAAHRH